MVKASVLVVPYVGSLTEIEALPLAAISIAGTCAVNCELLTKVVGSELPFQSIVDCGVNVEPFTVKVKDCAPAYAEEGLNPLIANVDFVTTYWTCTL